METHRGRPRPSGASEAERRTLKEAPIPAPLPWDTSVAAMKRQGKETGFYNEEQDFIVSWWNFCLQETLLPGKPWHKVLEKLEAAFAQEVKHKTKDLKQNKMALHLLGRCFVKRYYSDSPHSVDLNRINSRKLEDTRAWLQKQCFKAAEGTHCQFSFGANAAEVAPEMVHFLDDVNSIVTTELELLLATCEAQHKEKGKQENKLLNQIPLLPWNQKQTSTLLRRPKSIESEDISLALSRKLPSQLNINEKGFQLHIRPELHPPVLSCLESDLLGDLLCTIISQSSNNMSTTCERLSGKLLPKTLRQFIWIDKLLRSGSKNSKTEKLIDIEREARDSFGRTLSLQIAELNLRNATRSPVSGLIENAVMEVN